MQRSIVAIKYIETKFPHFIWTRLWVVQKFTIYDPVNFKKTRGKVKIIFNFNRLPNGKSPGQREKRRDKCGNPYNKAKKQTMNQRNQIHPNVNNTNTSHKWKYPIIIPFSEEFKSRTEFSKTPWCKQRGRIKKRSTGGFFKVNGPVGRISDRNQEGQCSCIQRPSGQLWEGRDEYEPSNEGTEATPSSLHSGSLICQGSRPSPARLAHYTCNAG